jgi:ABC-type transport system involved in multi-copper enzyme maturation permease subunit
MRPMWALLRRELFARVRGLGHFGVRFGYAALVFFLIVVFAQDVFFRGDLSQPVTRAPELGSILFKTFSALQFGLVALLVPLAGAGAVVEERESRSLPLLLLTRLTPWQIVLGKFVAHFGAVLLIILSNVPALFCAAFLGGVELMDVVRVSSLTLGLSALFVGVTLLSSAWSSTATRAASVSYGLLLGLLLSLFGLNWWPMQAFLWWNPFVTLSIALAEPLNLGSSWWVCSLLMWGVGLGAVLIAAGVLRRGVRRAKALPSGPRAGLAEGGRVWDNPVAWREWARRGRFWPRALGALSAGSLLSLVLLAASDYDVDDFALIGLNIVFFAVSLYTVAIGASAFTQEKREQTLDLLRLTRMRPGAILVGKMLGVWRLLLLALLLVLPSVPMAMGRAEQFDHVVWAPATLLTLSLGVTFWGCIGVFYSLVADTPIKAAFPAVVTGIYLCTMMFLWPMLIFQDDDFMPLAAAFGGALIFVPPLALVARANGAAALKLLAAVSAWMGMVILLGYFPDHEESILAMHPFVFVSSPLLTFEAGQWRHMMWLGGAVLLSATGIFAWASAILLRQEAAGGALEENSPGVAFVLSFICPGAGQIYLGANTRGLVIMGVSLFLACGLGIANILSAVDALLLAQRLHERRRERVARLRAPHPTGALT